MKRTIVAATIASVSLVLGACSDSSDSESSPTSNATTTSTETTSAAPTSKVGAGVYAPTDEVTSESYGIATRISDVSAINTRYGPGVVVTFDLKNNSDKIFEDYNWPSPQLSVGDRGVPVDQIFSMDDELGDGVTGHIPPGGSRVVRHGFETSMQDMTNATLSVGSIIWRGDFTTVTGGAPAPAPTGGTAAPAAPEAEPTAAAVAPAANTVDQLPNPYPNSRDSYGRATGTSGATLVGCAMDAQPGTGIYSDGSMDYAAECLVGGSMRPQVAATTKSSSGGGGYVVGTCAAAEEGGVTVSSKGEMVCTNGQWVTTG